MWFLGQKTAKVYHPDSLEVVSRFDPACVSSLNQSHGDANEEKHLSLLHTEERNVKKAVMFGIPESKALSMISYLVKWKRW